MLVWLQAVRSSSELVNTYLRAGLVDAAVASCAGLVRGWVTEFELADGCLLLVAVWSQVTALLENAPGAIARDGPVIFDRDTGAVFQMAGPLRVHRCSERCIHKRRDVNADEGLPCFAPPVLVWGYAEAFVGCSSRSLLESVAKEIRATSFSHPIRHFQFADPHSRLRTHGRHVQLRAKAVSRV
jgi:hypothetical protein